MELLSHFVRILPQKIAGAPLRPNVLLVAFVPFVACLVGQGGVGYRARAAVGVYSTRSSEIFFMSSIYLKRSLSHPKHDQKTIPWPNYYTVPGSRYTTRKYCKT